MATRPNAEQTVSEALTEPVAEAHEYLKAQDAVPSDETGHKRIGHPMWRWVGIAALVAVFMIRVNRHTVSAKELLGETFQSVLISDRYNAYNEVEITRRQLGWAHLRRELVNMSERNGESGRLGDPLFGCT